MRRLAIILLVIGLSSCSSTTPIESSREIKEGCRLSIDTRDVDSSLSIASPRDLSVDTTLRHGSNEDQLLSKQLYETLTWIDCTDTLRKGLASSWNSSDNDRSWIFFLRQDARYWNGAAITSENIVSQWKELWRKDPHIESIRATTSREIHVQLNKPDPDFPRLLADPGYSVMRSAPGIDWKVGSGPFRIESVRVMRSVGTTNNTTKIIRATSDSSPDRTRSLTFYSSDKTDSRDYVTDGIDIIATDDPQVIRYALDSGEYSDYPLPWDKTYVVAWGFHGKAPKNVPAVQMLPSTAAESLVNSISEVDARIGSVPDWYSKYNRCSGNFGSTAGALTGIEGAPDRNASTAPLRRIVYHEKDPVSKTLAERLSALSSSSSSDRQASEELGEWLPAWNDDDEMIPAVAVATEYLSESIKNGTDLYYVLPLPRRVLGYCSIIIGSYSSQVAFTPLSEADGFSFIPIIDTRRHLLLSRNVSGVSFDWFGNIKFVP